MLEVLEKVIPTLCHNNIYLLVKNILSSLLSNLFIAFVKYCFQIFLLYLSLNLYLISSVHFHFIARLCLDTLLDTFAIINTNDSLALFVGVCFLSFTLDIDSY